MWRIWKVGESIIWETEEFDGKAKFTGTVTKKFEDHLIVEADSMNLWVDDDTEDQFHK